MDLGNLAVCAADLLYQQSYSPESGQSLQDSKRFNLKTFLCLIIVQAR